MNTRFSNPFFEYIKISKKFSFFLYILRTSISENIQWYIVPKFLQLRQYQLNISSSSALHYHLDKSISRNERTRIIRIPCKGCCKKSFQWMNSPLTKGYLEEGISGYLWMSQSERRNGEQRENRVKEGIESREDIYIKDPLIKGKWRRK